MANLILALISLETLTPLAFQGKSALFSQMHPVLIAMTMATGPSRIRPKMYLGDDTEFEILGYEKMGAPD